MTTAVEGVEGSASRPNRSLIPGKTRYPLYRRLGGPQGRSGQVRKISPPTGIRSPDRPSLSQSLYRLSYRAHNNQYSSVKYIWNRCAVLFCASEIIQLFPSAFSVVTDLHKFYLQLVTKETPNKWRE